jgi:hypothetical protein
LPWLHTIKPLNNKNNWMVGITKFLPTLTLNVNGLNSSIKRHHLENWIKKEDLKKSVVYKRSILLTEINTGLGWKAGRRFIKSMTPQNRQKKKYVYQTKYISNLYWSNEIKGTSY